MRYKMDFKVVPRRWWSLKAWRGAHIMEELLYYQDEHKDDTIDAAYNLLRDMHRMTAYPKISRALEEGKRLRVTHLPRRFWKK